LFRQKLQQCCIVFDFEDGEADARGREIKRETLVELAEYVNTPVGQKIFTEAMMPDIIEMVKVRCFPLLVKPRLLGAACDRPFCPLPPSPPSL
jgi:hypothetical protein